MKNIAKMFLLIVLVALMGCSKKLNYTNLIKIRRPSHHVHLSAVKLNMPGINFGYSMGILGKHAIIYDSKADQLIKIADMNSERIVKSFGRRGQGPGEFIHPSVIFPDENNREVFWIYDKQRMLLNKFDISKVLRDEFNPDAIIKFTLEKSGYGYIDQMLMTPDERLIGIGLFLKDRIAVYRMDGSYKGSIGRIPVEAKNVDISIHHANAFSGRIALRKKSMEIFVAVQLGAIVEKYDMAGKLLSTMVGPDPFNPEYEIVNSSAGYSMTFNKKTRFGFLDILYHERSDRLFVLYSGKFQFAKGKNNRAWLGKTIYAMDGNGAIEMQFDLDKEIYRMSMSADGSFLWGMAEDGIYKFEMKKWLGDRLNIH